MNKTKSRDSQRNTAANGRDGNLNNKKSVKKDETLKVPNISQKNNQILLRGSYSSNLCGSENDKTESTTAGEKYLYDGESGQLDKVIANECVTPQKDASNTGNTNTYQFVNFVLEPSKKTVNSMKKRDRQKPIIDTKIINRQIAFQNRLFQYQKTINNQQQRYVDDLDEFSQHSTPQKRSSTTSSPSSGSKIVRGNLGFCPLDMSLVNLCGVPSLWLDPKEFATGGTKLVTNSYDQPQKVVVEQYIKPFQRKLVKKQYKVYELLRFHKIFESEKYFGRSLNIMHNQQNQTIFQDYYFFSTDFLKDNNKYQLQQLQQDWDAVYKTGQFNNQTAVYTQQSQLNIVRDKPNVLQILCSSQEVVQPELPVILDPEAATFKLINSEAKILKQILTSQGLSQTDQNEWNLLWTCISLQNKPQIYEAMHDYQKINHFQFSTELTRKDRYSDNMRKMKNKHGFYQFDFAPETYSLPEEMADFQKRFEQIQNNKDDSDENRNSSSNSHQNLKEDDDDDSLNQSSLEQDNCWIVKPSQSSQGKGIYIIEDINDLQIQTNPYNDKLERTVVCKYVGNPLLINNHKFDLRIYVLLTSVEPLRIYVYNEGLARFASEPYDNTSKGAKKNLYSHLTNYSINKKSDTFQQNKSVLERDHGNKWSMSALQSHLENVGINMQPVWERIYDAIIKSIIAVEPQLQSGVKKILNSSARTNCFELFGFDVLLDSQFKPHVLEVNFSPSLSADSPLDYHIKSNLLVDTLNLVGIKRNPKKRGTNNAGGAQRFRNGSTFNGGQMNNSQSLGFIQVNQAYSRRKNAQMEKNLGQQRSQSQTEMRNFTSFLNGGNIDQYFLDRLSKISAKHRELVFETLDEFQRNRNMNFTCIYPAPGSQLYDKFFVQSRPMNQIIHRYLFTKNEFYTISKQIDQYQKQTNSIYEQQLNSGSKTSKKAHLARDILKESDEDEANSQASKDSDEEFELQRQADKAKKIASRKVSQANEAQGSEQTPKIIIQEIESSSQTPGLAPSTKANSQSKLEIKDQPSQDQKVETPVEVKSHIKAGETTKAKSDIQDSQIQDKQKKEDIQSQSGLAVELPKQTSPIKLVHLNKSDSKKSELVSPPIPSVSPMIPLKKADLEDVKTKTDQSFKTEKRSQEIEATPTTDKNHSPLRMDNLEANLKSFDTPDAKAEDTPVTEQSDKKEKQKMIITGDDILIEYVHRIVKLMETILQCYREKVPVDIRKKSNDRIITKVSMGDGLKPQQSHGVRIEILEDILPDQIKNTLELFARHKIWSTKFSGSEDKMPLCSRIKKRHTEMVDRRARILKSTLKKSTTPVYTTEEIIAQLEKQDQSRDKIVSRISSQKIEKMVKQSNIENKIDIVSILVEGSFNLPDQMQTSSGKNVIKGTLQSLKLFEKIIKQTDYAEKIVRQNQDAHDQNQNNRSFNRKFDSDLKRGPNGREHAHNQENQLFLIRSNQNNEQCVTSHNEIPQQNDQFKSAMKQIMKQNSLETNKSASNSGPQSQSYSTDTYQFQRDLNNNSRGQNQMRFVDNMYNYNVLKMEDRAHNVVGGSHAINPDELVNEMNQNILDGKLIGREQGNQRHSLVFSDSKANAIDNSSQMNQKQQRLSSLFSKEHLNKQNKAKNNRNQLYQNLKQDMIKIVENNPPARSDFSQILHPQDLTIARSHQNYALILSQNSVNIQGQQHLLAGDSSHQQRQLKGQINQTGGMLSSQVGIQPNQAYKLNYRNGTLVGNKQLMPPEKQEEDSQTQKLPSPQNRNNNAQMSFERNRSKYSVAFNNSAIGKNQNEIEMNTEDGKKYIFKKQQTQKFEQPKLFSMQANNNQNLNVVDNHSYHIEKQKNPNIQGAHRNLRAANIDNINQLTSYGQQQNNDIQQQSGNKNRMMSFDSSQQKINVVPQDIHQQQQIPYFSQPMNSYSNAHNTMKGMRKNSQNLTHLDDKGIVLPQIGQNTKTDQANNILSVSSNHESKI